MDEGDLVTQDERELKEAQVKRKEATTKAKTALDKHRQLLLALTAAERSIVRATRRAGV